MFDSDGYSDGHGHIHTDWKWNEFKPVFENSDEDFDISIKHPIYHKSWWAMNGATIAYVVVSIVVLALILTCCCRRRRTRGHVIAPPNAASTVVVIPPHQSQPYPHQQYMAPIQASPQVNTSYPGQHTAMGGGAPYPVANMVAGVPYPPPPSAPGFNVNPPSYEQAVSQWSASVPDHEPYAKQAPYNPQHVSQ